MSGENMNMCIHVCVGVCEARRTREPRREEVVVRQIRRRADLLSEESLSFG